MSLSTDQRRDADARFSLQIIRAVQAIHATSNLQKIFRTLLDSTGLGQGGRGWGKTVIRDREADKFSDRRTNVILCVIAVKNRIGVRRRGKNRYRR